MAELTIEQQRALAMAAARKRAQEKASTPEFSGSILPFSRMPDGSVKFDSDAGIVGSVKRAFTLPGEVMRGEVPIRNEQGNISDEAIGRALEMGAVVSPANPMVRSGDKAIPGVANTLRKPNIAAPTADDLYKAAGTAYTRMRESGVEYSPAAVSKWARTVQQTLSDDGLVPTVAKKTHKLLDELATPPEGAIADIRGLQAARKALQEAARNFNKPSDQAAASRAIRQLDEFIGSGNPENIVAGTASKAATALKEGNANYAAAKRSDLITGIERAADLSAAAANSGQNVGNSARQRIKNALLSNKKTAGFSPEEIAALETVVRGTPAQNATRRVGNLLGGGGGLGQLAAGGVGTIPGLYTGSPELAALGAVTAPLIGAGAKQATNMLTERAIRAADEMVRMRSPLAKALMEKVPAQAAPAGPRAALIKALMLEQANAGGGGGF